MDIREIGWEVVDWVDVTQVTDKRRTVSKTAVKLRVPCKACMFLE
jgi:hypothetical protein